jgi:dienelactone hydrolase
MITPAVGQPPNFTVEGHRAGIDWAEGQNAAEGSPYAGHLDLDRVVASGNSWGGMAALGVASTDERVSSVFVLSGSSAFPGAPPEDAETVIDAVTAPIGYAVGGPADPPGPTPSRPTTSPTTCPPSWRAGPAATM